MLALGLVSRTVTRDVDVLARLDGNQLAQARPLPSGVMRAADAVGQQLNLPRDWINLQRLRRLQSESGLGQATVLAAIGRRLARRSIHAKWKSIQTRRTDPTEPLPRFPDLGHVGVPDPDFLAHGWLRGQVHPRRLATAPDFDHPANLILKLRALFGRQSRAEVMAWLRPPQARYSRFVYLCS